jgi:hypothetical protein
MAKHLVQREMRAVESRVRLDGSGWTNEFSALSAVYSPIV